MACPRTHRAYHSHRTLYCPHGTCNGAYHSYRAYHRSHRAYDGAYRSYRACNGTSRNRGSYCTYCTSCNGSTYRACCNSASRITCPIPAAAPIVQPPFLVTPQPRIQEAPG